MAKGKHLTLSDRNAIECLLSRGETFATIARELDKSPSCISKEVRARLFKQKSGSRFQPHNSCKNKSICEKRHVCSECKAFPKKPKFCKSCGYCNYNCSEYEQAFCTKATKPPYVCNGCPSIRNCRLEKSLYKAAVAQQHYMTTLSESRSGTSFDEDELHYLDEIISPLIKQHQSPHHICATNRDKLMVSERTIYRLIDEQLISAKNIDLPRKVRFRKRKRKKIFKVDKGCRIGRNMDDFNTFLKENPDTPIVQLDSVEGQKGKKVLLTIHFVKAELMLAFLREHNDSASVTEIFNFLYDGLGHEEFTRLFPVCLADNGAEFSNPLAIEYAADGTRRTRVFYCDANAPQQKGSAERNHEFIRFFVPKGKDFSLYTQEDITLMMNHINSYSRESLGNKCPFEMFEFLYGRSLLNLLNCARIQPQKITLGKSIFKGADSL